MTWTPFFVVASDGFMLVSLWKPLVFLALLSGWAWIISKRFDKHSAKFFLPRQNWNAFHLTMGTVATLVGFFIPIAGIAGFLAGLGAMALLLAADLFVYAYVTAKDERVPAEHRIRLVNLLGGTVKEQVKEDPALKAQGKVKLKITGADKQMLLAPAANAPEYAVRTAAEEVLVKALQARASQVELVPGSNGQYEAQMLVDSVKSTGGQLPPADAVKVMDFWKSAAKLDLADRRRKLVGLVTVEQGTDKKLVRITSSGGQGGMKLQLLIDPEGQVRRKADALGFLEEQLQVLGEITRGNKGLVLLAGLPDGGRTSLLYGVLGMHDAYTQTVQTMEMEQQATLEGVRHQQFDPSIEGADYATQTRSMLRRDPNVMGIGEIPDAATAKEIAKADYQRVRIYAVLRAGSAMEAVDGWVKAVGEPASAGKHLQFVVAGRLIRKLCTNCRVPYPASPELLAKLGVGAGAGAPQQLYKKGGQVLVKNKPETCPLCQGVGYYEQSGIFEILPIGDEERELIVAGNIPGLRAAMKKRGIMTIQQAAIRKALSGATSVEEVMRVTTAQPGAAPAAQAAQGAKT